MLYYVSYITALVLSCVALLFLMTMVYRRRQTSGGKAMMGSIAAMLVYAFFSFLETIAPTREMQDFFFRFSVIGLMFLPPCWLIFSVNYTGGNKTFTGWRILPLFLIPVGLSLVIANNGWVHWYYTGERMIQSGPFLLIDKEWGIAFWISVVHNYTVMLTGFLVIGWRMLPSARIYKSQGILLLLAIALPLVWNAIYVFDLFSFPEKDLSPVFVTISVIIILLGLMRYSLFLVVPFAKQYFFDNMKDAILVFDGQNRLVETNPAAMTVFNLQKSDLGKTDEELRDHFPFDSRTLMSDAELDQVSLLISGEERFFEIETVLMSERKSFHIGTMVIFRDITERKNFQDQISAQDRLASIGKLTSGVAHEINNPLAIIKGLTELLLDSEINGETREDVTTISEEVDRATSIVSNLLTFARRQHGEKRFIDVNEIIQKTVALREYELTCNNIQTILDLSPDLPRIVGNNIQIRQVITNLIINAEFFITEANGQGTIEVSTREVEDMVYIRIKDDGPGISQENISRIFDPFFTTKRIGQGTGLGLSICHGIITEHGGDITVESKPGDGTAFIITLPVADEQTEKFQYSGT
ncbi:MAG: PAS domain-containing protein [Dehalococcoidales bacterium]|nr:PAS domain-containing protein [Dehalococcoidales bacterium]